MTTLRATEIASGVVCFYVAAALFGCAEHRAPSIFYLLSALVCAAGFVMLIEEK